MILNRLVRLSRETRSKYVKIQSLYLKNKSTNFVVRVRHILSLISLVHINKTINSKNRSQSNIKWL